MIVSSGLMFLPTSIVLDAEHDLSSDEDLSGNVSLSGHSSLTDYVAMEAADTAIESASASGINDIAPDLAPPREPKARAGFRPIARGMIKPLVAMLTAQYVIVGALVAGAAVTVAHYASQLVNEKFGAIVVALKRL